MSFAVHAFALLALIPPAWALDASTKSTPEPGQVRELRSEEMEKAKRRVPAGYARDFERHRQNGTSESFLLSKERF